MKQKSAIILFLMSVLFMSTSYGQLITGRVLGETGVAASAVTVQFMNKANGVMTNNDGTFKIMAKKLPDTLVFSSVGYEPYKVRVTDKTVKDIKFEIVLLQARHELDEVLVVGHGKTVKRSITASAATISSKEITSGASARLDDGLAGKVAGVVVSSSDRKAYGSPGSSVRIRGYSSIIGSTEVAKTADLNFSSGKKITFNDSVTMVAGEKAYQTKLVTAGEVNDFNKWKMWEDFSETDFKVYSNQWNLFTKNRYCVQLQNKNYKPVAGRLVSLINKTTRDTVWNSVTDNTGKAELWAGMNIAGSNAGEQYYISVKGYRNIESPTIFANGINRLQLEEPCNENAIVDIAFVVDATGSMADEIEFLKLELEAILHNTFDKFGDLNVRASSVFYRDKGDEYVTRHVDFNSDLLKVLNFIKLQKAGGGGDTPEAVESALHTALDSLTWSENARTKLLFLVLDAGPHEGTQPEIFKLIQQASAKGIRVVPIVCSGADKGTEFLMRSIALATNGTYVFLTDNSGVGGSHLKPTTDVFTVELLSNLLQRLVGQTLYMPACATKNETLTEPLIKQPDNILKVTISPNPTSGSITIASNKPLKEIFIADFTGKLLFRLTGTIKQEKWETDLSQYPAGTYIVKYITNENEWGAGKVILVR